MDFIETMRALWESTGIAHSIAHGEWQNYVMIVISFVLFYLAVVKQFEPLLLLPIAFGMFIVNIPGAQAVLYGTDHGLSDQEMWAKYQEAANSGATYTANYGLFHYLEIGVSKVIFPPIIFLGIGAMTDFGPLIANPKSLLIGAAAQLGVFLTFVGASRSALPARRLRLSALSAARTDLRQFMLRKNLRRICCRRSLLRRIRTWRLSR